jgi:hypothetical protein
MLSPCSVQLTKEKKEQYLQGHYSGLLVQDFILVGEVINSASVFSTPQIPLISICSLGCKDGPLAKSLTKAHQVNSVVKCLQMYRFTQMGSWIALCRQHMLYNYAG